MLEPRPVRSTRTPKPTKILCKTALLNAWNDCRDSTANPGSSGIDKVTALQFAAKLDVNLTNIAKRIKTGDFGFSPLRAVFIPKPNSDKERIICIPTVCDRLVQRVISEYLTSKQLLPIYNTPSFGFIDGKGVSEAVNAVVKFRREYDWCLKTDIESFFDRIPRNYLKQEVRRALRRSSLVPLICKAIDSEAQITRQNSYKFQRQGLKRGEGVRQGMPLSPILANLALADFDKRVLDANIEMVRYADDIVLFCKTKSETEEAEEFVRRLLKEIQLTIPKIADNSKTALIHKTASLIFLGREIVHLGSEGDFIARVPRAQIKKIKTRLLDDFSFEQRSKEGKNFQETMVDLSKSISAYLGIYRDAHNYKEFADEMREHARAIIRNIFRDMFGSESLSALTNEKKKFLGLDCLDLAPDSQFNV